MISAVIVNLDNKLKERAMKRAKSQGVPLSAVIRLIIVAYANGELEFGIIEKRGRKTPHNIHFNHV
jgi:antitoxin component of RelBE/YafQ-DinJ toxin-antitoxin module